MSQRQRRLGDCPVCGASLPEDALLAAYEADGWPAFAAECPDCAAVVHPR
ncbi:hypothetical protein [Halobacterium yunchengense]